MLYSLHIVNFAIIEDTVIELSSGTNVFTGETGAGKSILVDAIALLLGKRAKADFIRHGSDFFRVEGVFHVSPKMSEQLREDGIDVLDDEVVISREMTVTGRGMCMVNGTFCTVKQLEQYGRALVRLHEQNDHMELLSSTFFQKMIDSSGKDIDKARIAYTQVYRRWNTIRKDMEDLANRRQEYERRLDTLRYEIKSIREADLQEGEDVILERRLSLLRNHEKILTSLKGAIHSLSGDGKGRDFLAEAVAEVEVAFRYDESLRQSVESLQDVVYAVEDVLGHMESYVSHMDFSEKVLDEAEERAHLLRGLKRKYGPELEDVLSYAMKAEEEYNLLENYLEEREELQEKEKEYRDVVQKKAHVLNQLRKEKGEVLLQKMKTVLHDLGMEDVTLELRLIPSVSPTLTAVDEMEVYFSANPGEPLRPIRETASGGEISRISLAIEIICSKLFVDKTLIFDEIDVGISGKTAVQVAEKIKKLSEKVQVICITHLPQTASIADAHFRIEKTVKEGRTATRAVHLSEEEHIRELSRMIGGDANSEGAWRAAKEMKRHFKLMVH